MRRYPEIAAQLDPFSATPERRLLAAYLGRAIDDYFKFKRELNKASDSAKVKKTKIEQWQQLNDFIFQSNFEADGFTLSNVCFYLSKDGEALAQSIRNYCLNGEYHLRKFSVSTRVKPCKGA